MRYAFVAALLILALVPAALADHEGIKDVSAKEIIVTVPTGAFDKPAVGDLPRPATAQVGPGGCSGPEECAKYCSIEQNREECSKFGARFKEVHYEYREYSSPRPPEDFDPEQMIIGMIFAQAEEKLNPAEFAQHCGNPEQMVDLAIQRLKEQNAFNIEAACQRIEREAGVCRNRAEEGCSRIHGPQFAYNDREYGCDATREDLKNFCVSRSRVYWADEKIRAQCEAQWEQRGGVGTCARPARPCEKGEFLEDERAAVEERCRVQHSDNEEAYSKCVNDYNFDNTWAAQEQICDSFANACNRDLFVNRCVRQFTASQEQFAEKYASACDEQAAHMHADLQRICAHVDESQQRCKDQSQKFCGFQERAVEKCRSLTEADVRAAMIKQAEKMCKYYNIKYEKRRVYLAEVGQLVEKADQVKGELPATTHAILDEGTNEAIEADEEIVETQKNDGDIIYNIQWALGLAAKTEKEEATKIKQSASKLANSIEVLTDLLGQLDSEAARKAMKEQLEALKARQVELEKLAQTKEKRAGGLLALLTGG